MQKILLAIFLFPLFLMGQASELDQAKYETIGHQFINENLEELGLTKADVQNMVITDLNRNNNNGWVQIYFGQTHKGIQVNNAVINLNVKPDGSVPFYGNTFIPNFRSKVDSDIVLLNASQAINSAAYELGVEEITEPVALKSDDKLGRQYFVAPYAVDKISAEMKYIKIADGSYRTSWEIYIAEKNSADTWYSYVDGVDGSILSKRNNTIYCAVHKGMFHNHTAECRDHHTTVEAAEISMMGDGAKYTVYELPIESPIHGTRTVADDPSDPVASPHGWHDTNNQPGAEHTITRGNNVWAYEDTSNTNTSRGNEPDGGADLVFDFNYDPLVNPILNVDSDITQLFYNVNMMHDLTYKIGFDSEAGNFQENTYGAGGNGGDFVRAEGLDASVDDNGVVQTNNANFATPSDGQSGRMQMFRWLFTDIFRLTAPGPIAKDYTTSQADWLETPDYTMVDINAEIVIARDNNANPQFAAQACEDIVTDVDGKIALIRRGVCEFGRKALNAEEAGAIAVIICNVPGVNGGDGETLLNMGAGEVGDMVTIPVIALPHSDCVLIEAAIRNGEQVDAELASKEGPGELSGSFDNGVVAHEFGHGISNRLVGGPRLNGCLTNDEQVGEGISDYFTLVTTTNADHRGTDLRGIGNFADGQQSDGRGIRRFPYSTDMTICPLTMDDIRGTGDSTDADPDNNGVHALGEVWAATLWDMYWAFTDLYGWTDDWNDDTKGNVKAMKLVMDGMKAVGCNPGYREMRDAIFAVDNGEHNCLLWEIFARRGMGFFADFGDSNERDDNIEDFEPLPTCITTLKIKREIGVRVAPGDILDVNIWVANHTGELSTNTIVTDFITDGLTIVDGSTNIPYTLNGNDIIFEIGDMEYLDELSFSYQLATDPNRSSTTRLINTSETSEERAEWIQDINGVGFNFWDAVQFDAKSGQVSWQVAEVDADSDQRLEYNNLTVVGDRPTLRFWQKAFCTPQDNGGFVEISTDGGTIWTDVNGKFIRGGYNNPIVYANLALPGLEGFSGYQDEFTDSYIDLSEYQGQTIDVRFRFATYDIDENAVTTFLPTDGWYIDDLELMDLKTYEVEATISADNADLVTDGVKEIVMDSDGVEDGTSTEDLSIAGVEVNLNPNPASDHVTVNIKSDRLIPVQLQVLTIDGRILHNNNVEIRKGANFVNLDLSTYDSGLYLVQLRSEDKVTTKKLSKK